MLPLAAMPLATSHIAGQILLALDPMSVLQRNAVAPQKFLVYLASVLRFAAFCRERDLRAGSADEVDAALHSFLVWTYQDDPSRGAKTRMVHAVFGYEFLVPAHCKQMVGCQLALRGWDRLVPHKSPPPLSFSILNRISCECEKRGLSVYNIAFC